jgi:hypothetical protein
MLILAERDPMLTLFKQELVVGQCRGAGLFSDVWNFLKHKRVPNPSHPPPIGG